MLQILADFIVNFLSFGHLVSEIDKLVSDLKLELGGSNQKTTNKIDDQGPKPICRHPLDFTVTITLINQVQLCSGKIYTIQTNDLITYKN